MLNNMLLVVSVFTFAFAGAAVTLTVVKNKFASLRWHFVFGAPYSNLFYFIYLFVVHTH